MSNMTTVRVPERLRDEIKAGAATYHETQAAFLERALRELKQREFLDEVAAYEPDAADRTEYEQWERADIGPELPE